MELDLQSCLQFGAGVGIGCLAAGIIFWVYVALRKRSQVEDASQLPVHLGRDLNQAVILEKENKKHEQLVACPSPGDTISLAGEEGLVVKMRGRFLGWMSPQRKVDPTMDVYIPSTRRIMSPTYAKPESPQPAPTPRIYVLPVSPSGTPQKSALVSAKLDRRSKSSKQGEFHNSLIFQNSSPMYGGKIDKVPNWDILRSPVAQRKELGETTGGIGQCSGIESDESDNSETRNGEHQAYKRSMNQTNPECEEDRIPGSRFSSFNDVPDEEALNPSPDDISRTLVGLPGLQVEIVDSGIEKFISELKSSMDCKDVVYMISLVMEEVLPRPESGLLKRMLRMAEVPMTHVEGCLEPIFNLRTASQCHLSIGMIAVQDIGAAFEISGPIRVSIQPIDGEAANLDVNHEQVNAAEHVATAFWDMKEHGSKLLMTPPATSPSSTSLTPIELSLGFHVKAKGGDTPRHGITAKKTILAKMRKGLTGLDVGDCYQYSEKIMEYVLSDLELVSMPSLLMFMRVYEQSD